MPKIQAAEFFKQTSWDFVADVEAGAINRAIARSKIVELLHKQLVRKGRINGTRARIDLGNIAPFGECYAVTSYDIKSPSKAPYDYNSYENLGLNQFFVGQSPYKPYNGNPKDGIYHDTSIIIIKKHSMDKGTLLDPPPNTDVAEITEYKYFESKKIKINEENDSGNLYFTGQYRTEYLLRKDKIERDWGKILKVIRAPNQKGIDALIYGDMWYICESGYAIEIGLPYIGNGSENDGTRDGFYRIHPLFYKEHHMPVGGAGKWMEKWSEIYELVVEEDNDFEAFLPIIAVALVVITYVTAGATSGAWGALASGTATMAQVGAISTFLGVVSLNLTLIGTLRGDKGLVRIGRVVGFIGAIGSIYTAAKEFFFQGAAKAGASALPNSTIAGMQGMSQTGSLYTGIGTNGFANVAYTTAGTTTASNTSSVMFSSSENAFSSALAGQNIGTAVASVNTSQLYLTQAINALKIGYKSYSLVQNIRGAFREANRFDDEDMNEQSDEEKAVAVSSELVEDENGFERRFYQRDMEYDLGLEGGTLMSNDDSLLT